MGSERTETLSEQIARTLRAALVSGQLAPGEIYSVPALAEEFGVSAMPAREAMLSLVQQGLMRAVPNKGFRVVELSPKELDDIMELRLLVEVPTIVKVAENISEKTMRDLRRIAKDITRAAKAGQLVEYIEQDRQFHLTLTSLADNPRLDALIDDLRSRSRLVGLGALAEHGDLEASSREHLEMLDAIAEGDSTRLRALMERHIRHSRGIWAGLSE